MIKFLIKTIHLNRRNFCRKEVLDFSKKKQQAKENLKYDNYQSIVIHPILYPNSGYINEVFLAEEAIGLAKALQWTIVQGPFNKSESDDKQLNNLSQNEDDSLIDQKSLKDGDYIYTPLFKGTYYKGGILVDWSTDSESDNEWTNLEIRNQIAKTSLLRVRSIKMRTFFQSGNLNLIAQHIKDKNIDCVFINTELSILQTNNLEKYFTSIRNNLPMDSTFKKRRNPLIPSDIETYSENSDQEEISQQNNNTLKKVKVFDRYTIILQIFAKRANSKLARSQIELSFIKFLRQKMTSGKTYCSSTNIFNGDLMNANELSLKVETNRQRKGGNQMMGEGESQLEIQKRILQQQEQKIIETIQNEMSQKQLLRGKRINSLQSNPRIAIIGYTNAGKSKLMNKLLNQFVASTKNSLFQTLDTKSKKYYLNQGQQAIILDTIGFITNLPHELIQSFESTLNEVLDADILLHVRDISHPSTKNQYDTVINLLKNIAPEIFNENRIIEVWNKIDLLNEPLDLNLLNNSQFTIVPISAEFGTNIKKLENIIQDRLNIVTGRKLRKLKNCLSKHQDRLQWLFKYKNIQIRNGNINCIQQETYNYKSTQKYPQGYIEFSILLDDITYRRYLNQFDLAKDEPKDQDQPPKDWLLGSKSYFDKK